MPDDLLDFKPHEKTNPIRTIMAHQILSERRFFAQFVGTEEPPVEELLPSGEKPIVAAYIDKYLWLVRRRFPQLAGGPTSWWLEKRTFFGGLQRERIWVFWRRVLHNCHHRPPCNRGCGWPSGDVKWAETDPTRLLHRPREPHVFLERADRLFRFFLPVVVTPL